MKRFFKIIKEYRKFFLFVIFIALWVVLLSYVDLEAIANSFSAGGSYVAVFFVALLGGVSVFTSSSYIATLVTLSLGPANPILLALSAGIALTLGDNLFYYFGSKGRSSLPPIVIRRLDKLADWLEKKSKAFIYCFVYVYTGLTPLPADALMLALSFANYPMRRLILPVFLGNVTLLLVIYHLVRAGVDFAGA